MEMLGQEWGQGTSRVHLPPICSSSPAVRACCDLKREDSDFTQLIAFKKDKSINTRAFTTQHAAQTPSWGGFAGMGWLQCGQSCISSIRLNLGTSLAAASLVGPQ